MSALFFFNFVLLSLFTDSFCPLGTEPFLCTLVCTARRPVAGPIKNLADNSFNRIFGPNINPAPYFLGSPIRIYWPPFDRNKIRLENKKKAVVYQ